MPTLTAIIFDLEALWPGSARAYTAALKACSADPLAAREAFVAQAEARLHPAGGADAQLRHWKDSGLALALLTGLPLKPAGELVKLAGWRRIFGVFVGAEHAGAPWPSAAWWELAVRRISRPPGECLGLAADRAGVAAARAAGLRVAAVGSGLAAWRLRRAGAACVARDLADPKLNSLLTAPEN